MNAFPFKLSVAALKLLGGFTIVLCILGFGLFPIQSKTFRKNKMLLSLSNCFSGGLFLAMGLVHVLPEAAELLEHKKPFTPTLSAQTVGHGCGSVPGHSHCSSGSHGHDHSHTHSHSHSSSNSHGHKHAHSHGFPVSYFICLMCFSLILIIDKVLFNSSAKHAETHLQEVLPDAEERHAPSHDGMTGLQARAAAEIERRRNQHIGAVMSETTREPLPLVPTPAIVPHTHHDHHHHHESHAHPTSVDHRVRTKHNDDDDSHHHHHTHQYVDKNSLVRSYMLIMAMSVHNIFAGLAFGIAETERDVIGMFIAMIMHKWSEALSIGINIVNAEVPYWRGVWMIVFFSALNPMGMLIGWKLSSSNDTVKGVCMALSAGTFLYISCAETIVDEFSNAKNKFKKLLTYLLGIALVTVFTYFE